VTDKTSAPVVFGTATTLTFTNGVSTAGGSMKLYEAKVDPTATNITVADGGITQYATLDVDVDPALVDKLWLSGTGTQEAGKSQTIAIQAKDAYCNVNNEGTYLYSGAHTLVFAGANDSRCTPAHDPTVDAVPFGGNTSISFANGAATASMKLVDMQAASITVSEGGLGTYSPLSVVVSPTGSDYIVVQTASGEGGVEAGAYTMTTDQTWGPLYAAVYDTFCNYKGDSAAAWSRTGTIDPPTAGPASSITYAPTTTNCPNPTGTIVATVSGKTDATGTVTVGFGKVATVSITPGSWNQNIRTNQVVTGQGWDADGNEIYADTLVGTLAWSLVDPGLPLRGPGGTIVPGSGTVTATYTAGSVPNVYTDAVQFTSNFKGGTPTAAKATPTVKMVPLVVGWNMVGVPYDFASAQTPAAVWDEFAGSPLWAYTYGSGGYEPVTGAEVDIGPGYWLGILTTGTDGRWDATGSEVTGTYVMSFANAGWHLVGEPFRQASTVWTDTKFMPTGGSEWHAFDSDTLLNTVYAWNGTTYTTETRLAPYLGYWVGTIYPTIDIQLQMAANNQNAIPEPGKPSALSWRLPLVAEVLNSTPSLGGERLPGMVLRDEVAALGVEKGASVGYDAAYDRPAPPVPMGDYIRVYFDRPGWSEVFGREYATDIRKAFRAGTEAWDFNVRTTVLGEQVTLSWSALGGLPASVRCTLVDLDGGSVVNMRDVDVFRYTSGVGERRFQVTVEIASSQQKED
jgi:hypothetical protein